jgi:hypothetical protein
MTIIKRGNNEYKKISAECMGIHYGKNDYYGITRLHDGTLLWLYPENQDKKA